MATVSITLQQIGPHRPLPGQPVNGFIVAWRKMIDGVLNDEAGIVFAGTTREEWIEAVREYVASPTADPGLVHLLRRIRKADPTFQNLATFEGKTLTYDPDVVGAVT